MEAEIWEDEFYNEIEERDVPGYWELYEDEALHMQEKGAKYTQRTFGRFRCSGCRRTWNSAEVHVLFFMTLNKALQQGTVKMRIFRQECKKCNYAKLEQPEISHENIVRIITNVVNRILQVFYGQKKDKQDLKPEVYGKEMEGPHDKEHCEACNFKVCKWQIVATQNQSEARSIPAQTTQAPKPKTKTKKAKKLRSKKKTPSTASTNPKSSSTYQSTTTYSDYGTSFDQYYDQYYEEDYRWSSMYPNYAEEQSTSLTSGKKEASSFPFVASIALGIAALTFWYLNK